MSLCKLHDVTYEGDVCPACARDALEDKVAKLQHRVDVLEDEVQRLRNANELNHGVM